MTIESWLQAAIADAEKRGLPELKPILETLARATTALRRADFNDDASGSTQSAVVNPQSAVDSPQPSAGSGPSSGLGGEARR
jgi:hypothetical protein